MKWMWSAIVVLAVSSAAMAQPAGTPATNDTMSTTYTGCVEAVNHGASYMLTHVDHRMSAMHDGKMHDAKMHDGMMHDAKMHDANMMSKDDAMPMKDGEMAMAPASLVLTGKDLKKHVGQTVSVTGSVAKAAADAMRPDLQTFVVSSLKVVARSCTP
jgi:hypothetical protein